MASHWEQRDHNVLENRGPGYGYDTARMCRYWPAIRPAVRARLGILADQELQYGAHPLPPLPADLQSIHDRFYERGLYKEFPPNASPEDYMETVVAWSAALCTRVQELVLYDAPRLCAQTLQEIDRAVYGMPMNTGLLVLLRTPTWSARKDDRVRTVANAIDRVLWGRPTRPARATIIVGDVSKYPFMEGEYRHAAIDSAVRGMTNKYNAQLRQEDGGTCGR